MRYRYMVAPAKNSEASGSGGTQIAKSAGHFPPLRYRRKGYGCIGSADEQGRRSFPKFDCMPLCGRCFLDTSPSQSPPPSYGILSDPPSETRLGNARDLPRRSCDRGHTPQCQLLPSLTIAFDDDDGADVFLAARREKCIWCDWTVASVNPSCLSVA